MRCLVFTCLMLALFSPSCSQQENKNQRPKQNAIPYYDAMYTDEYILMFNDYAQFEASADFFKQDEILKTYAYLNAYHVKMDLERLSEAMRNPDIKYIEPNSRFRINQSQQGATWGIDRIDSKKGLDNVYNYAETGKGVTAYIVDTGVDTRHSEFQGRIKPGYSAVSGGYEDCHGHGTHVAGTVAGKTYGVAKEADIVPVRVLDCQGSGSLSGILDGLNWIISNAKKPAVANMSLGGSKSQSLDEGVKKAIAAGITFVVAAGNDTEDACNYSPANVPEAITVAAMDRGDARASFSNYGSCVDIFAPGKDILSAKKGGGSASMSGTSMASPHGAGVAALFLERKPDADPSEIWSYMKNLATQGVVSDTQGSANLLVFTDPNNAEDPEEPTPSPTPKPNPTPSPTPKPTPNPTPSPTPKPNPGKPGFCEQNKCLHFRNSLGMYQSDTLPPERPFFVNGKTIEAKLIAPGGFQILLWKTMDPYYKNWEMVAESDSEMKLTGSAGFYAFVVLANTSSGVYDLWFALK